MNMRLRMISCALVAFVVAIGAIAPAAARRRAPASAPSPVPSMGPCATAPPQVAPIVATSENPNLHVTVGQVFVLSLGTSPGTGYHWIDTNNPGSRPFGTLGQSFRASSQAGGQPDLGAPGEQLWLFRATGPGTGKIELRYVPPTGKIFAGEATVDLTVTVDPSTAVC